MDTWVFFGGRWKVIYPRGIWGLIFSFVFVAWLAGALCGAEFSRIQYEKRIAAIERHVDERISVIDHQIKELNRLLH